MEVRHTGEDFSIVSKLKNKDGSALVSADISGLLIFLIHSSSGQVVQKYSLNAQEGFNEINLTDNAGAVEAEIDIKREESLDFPIGEYKIEVKVQTSDVDFTDGNFHTINKATKLFHLDPATIRAAEA